MFDCSRYRSAGREVIEVLKKNCSIVERASVDEAYLDLTQMVDDKLSKELFDSEDVLLNLKNTFVVGHSESGINDEGSFSFIISFDLLVVLMMIFYKLILYS